MTDEFILKVNRIQVENKYPPENLEGYEVVTNKDTIKILIDSNDKCCECHDSMILTTKDNSLLSEVRKEFKSLPSSDDNSEPSIDIHDGAKTTRWELFSTEETTWTLSKKEYLKHKNVPWKLLEDFSLVNGINLLLEIAQDNEKDDEKITIDRSVSLEKDLDIVRVTYDDGQIRYTTVGKPVEKEGRTVVKREELRKNYRYYFSKLVSASSDRETNSATIKLTTNKGDLYLSALNNHNGYYSHQIFLKCNDFDYSVDV
jgi:hypothetical protein